MERKSPPARLLKTGGLRRKGMQEKPVVYLVGAGPGDPDLMTIKGKRILENADVVVYDRLVSEDILGLVGPGTARIDVGKQPGLHSVPQDEINALVGELPARIMSVLFPDLTEPERNQLGGFIADQLEKEILQGAPAL